jgi:transcriptional regulator with XRE-family HTH domain
MNYDLKLIAQRLLDTMHDRNYYSQKDICKKTGIHKTMMSSYCKGRRKPSQDSLIKLCAALKCSPKWIMEGKGSIHDRFNIQEIDDSRTSLKISAMRIDDIVEVRFFVSQTDFSTFVSEAKRDGCID